MDVRDIRHMPPGPVRKLKISAFVGVITALCPCGNPEPVTLPVVPGTPSGMQCSACQVIWQVEKIDYFESRERPIPGEEPKPVKVNVGCRGIVPEIIQAKTFTTQ